MWCLITPRSRHGRFRESDVFRHVFESVLQRCISEGLIGGEGFAIDASVVKADAARASGFSGSGFEELALGPAEATRAVREYLEGLEADGRPQAERKSISVTDPAAEWTCAPGGPAFFAYSTNYLVDVQEGLIVDVEGTSAYRIDEVNATRTMIDRVEERFGIKPAHLIGDTAYGTASTLGWLVDEKNVDPHIPVWTRADQREGTIPNSDFKWNEKADEYRCPQGHALRRDRRTFKVPRTHITRANTIIYRASQIDCACCPMKSLCCPSTPMRKITRSVHEAAREFARRLATTAGYRESRRNRKKVEMLFAHLKRVLKLDRLRLRGPSGAHDEFLLAAIAQNLRRMAMRFCPPPLPLEILTT
jgi:hypothetical protein